MNWRLLTARIVLALATLAMAVLTGCASRTIIGLALLLTTASVAEHVHAEGARNTFRAALAAAWLLSGCVVYTLSRGNEKVFGLYLAFTAWLVSAVLSPFSTASFRAAPVGRRLLAITWLCFGTGVALTLGYTYDATEFMVGLAGLFVTILVLLWWFKMPGFCRQALITLLLVIAGLPIVSHFLRPMAVVQEPVTDFEKYYSYEAAKKDPDAYRAWQYYAMTKWMAYEKVAMDRKHVGDLPWHLRPNTRAKLYDGEIPINSLGFRGPEFSPHKTNTYRIIAVGESTTFGVTLTPDHHPWPELLEAMIRERLKLTKPVEVINAGVPGRTLPQNVYRLKHELLSLEPDMLISYHGYNGFGLLNKAIPPPSGPPPPPYIPRPLKLLADVEYHVKLSLYRRTRIARTESGRTEFVDPLKTPYADAYREFIQIAESNHIQVVLSNYSMAVNAESDSDLIQFYRAGFPAIYEQIKANEAHSTLVEKLSAENPELCFVNTHPHLDGEHQRFADLMHFNKKGDQQMAETFFAAIRPILERKLGNEAATR